MGFFNANQIFG